MPVCQYCGLPLRKRSNRQIYHKKCEKYANQENDRNRFQKFYKTHIKRGGIQTYNQYKKNLGTGSLSSIPNSDTSKELELIQKEKTRLGIY